MKCELCGHKSHEGTCEEHAESCRCWDNPAATLPYVKIGRQIVDLD